VADIALGVHDAAAAFHEAVRRGRAPRLPAIAHGDLVTATIMGVGDMAHTFVQRAKGADPRTLPGLQSTRRASNSQGDTDPGLSRIDHFAVCVEAGQIDAAVGVLPAHPRLSSSPSPSGSRSPAGDHHQGGAQRLRRGGLQP